MSNFTKKKEKKMSIFVDLSLELAYFKVCRSYKIIYDQAECLNKVNKILFSYENFMPLVNKLN